MEKFVLCLQVAVCHNQLTVLHIRKTISWITQTNVRQVIFFFYKQLTRHFHDARLKVFDLLSFDTRTYRMSEV